MVAVKIFKPAKTAMQDATAKTHRWVMVFETEKGQYTEPIMNWTGSISTRPQVRLTFATQEEAIRFAKEQNWGYKIILPHERRIIPKSYASNFTQSNLNH